MSEVSITHVSDTALWVATYRAQESERPDAVFRDPLAKKLAGERGAQFAASLEASAAMAFAMVVRTTAIDRLVQRAIAQGVDAVVNLGAGLDTRPYRLELPADLRWIEVDFPALMDYKAACLADDMPRCRVERVPLDLADATARGSLLERVGRETRRCLVITEGVIAYLGPEEADQLSRELFAVPSVAYWIQDYARGKFRRVGDDKVKRLLGKVPFRFDSQDPLAFFGQHGWVPEHDIAILDEADRIGRSLPIMFPWTLLMKLMPGPIRAIGNRTYGYVMFAKA
ncbi:putative S-adenosyl-L-methionine-dependent methyltransferase [compost metagenome]